MHFCGLDTKMQQELLEEYGKPVHEVDVELRRGFIQKVFGIVSLQLLTTLGFAALFSLYEPLRVYVDFHTEGGHPWVSIAATVFSLAFLTALMCCSNQMRNHTTSIIFLIGFTLAESVMVGVACTAYTIGSVLIAVGATVFLVASLAAYAFFTTRDFTGAGPYLYAFLIALILYGITLFVHGFDIKLSYAYAGVVLFSCYIVHDMQMIIGGEHHKYKFGVDEYVFAALHIYLDVINVLVDLLKIFGVGR